MRHDKEKRDEHGCLVIDETNIHLYTRTIGYVRQNVITHCSSCGKFLKDGQHGPGGLCHECNAVADWDDSPGEDYDVGF